MQSHFLGTPHPLANAIMLTYGQNLLSDFAGLEMAYFPRALHAVIYRVMLSSWITLKGKSRIMGGYGVWRIEIHHSNPPSRKDSLPSSLKGSLLTASPAAAFEPVTLCSEWPQPVTEQGHGVKTWPFPSDGDSAPTGNFAMEQPLGVTVYMIRWHPCDHSCFLTFPSTVVTPPPPHTLCIPNSVWAPAS